MNAQIKWAIEFWLHIRKSCSQWQLNQTNWNKNHIFFSSLKIHCFLDRTINFHRKCHLIWHLHTWTTMWNCTQRVCQMMWFSFHTEHMCVCHCKCGFIIVYYIVLHDIMNHPWHSDIRERVLWNVFDASRSIQSLFEVQWRFDWNKILNFSFI